MSLVIGSYEFDAYRGVIQIPQSRVEVFAASHVAAIGAQILPPIGPPFQVDVTRFDTAANLQTVVNAIEALLGTVNNVVRDGYNFGTTASLNFLVEGVMIKTATKSIAVRTLRNGTTHTYSPACHVVATLTMRAVPTA